MAKQTAEILNKRKEHILKTWIDTQVQDPALREDLMSNEDMHRESEELLDAFIRAIQTDNYNNIEAHEYNSIIELLSNISLSRAHTGFTPRETATFVMSLKRAIIRILQDEYQDNLDVLINEVLKVSDLLDSLSIITMETYLKGREEVIVRQSNEINEISTPVIKVWEGVLAMPIIGTIDSARTQIVMESLLQEIVDSGCSIAILDISGVPTVDSLVAQHLIKTVNATRLMGAECIISGIKPDIAQTIVHLGIDLSGVQTKTSLAAALQMAFTKMNLVVRKTQ
uniref:STAS domain-containing protein n=1 Tax=Roseihalotalea indica TaxID=2867963 RepID=A0AA49GP61_9BACT|nr:STAS domain-containing protein [Tunicatimonas sp. TK19036]